MIIDIEKIDFDAIGERLKAYRLIHGFSPQEMAKKANIRHSSITSIESGRRYRSLNQLWAVVGAEGLSIPWFFYGEGRFDDKTAELLPLTLIRKRGAGIRRNEDRRAAETGQYADDPFEFVLAVEGYKKFNSKPFPTLTEIFEVLLSLGYRKTKQPTINPRKALSDEHPESK